MTNRAERRPGGRTFGVMALVSVLAIIAGLLGTAQAGAQQGSILDGYEIPEWMEVGDVLENGDVEFMAPIARVYGDKGEDWALVAGADLLSVCLDEPPASQPGVLWQQSSGTFANRVADDVQVRGYLYEKDPSVDIFEFFGQVCGGFFENGSPIPAPYASGYMDLRNRERGHSAPFFTFEEQPAGRYRNSARGTLADRDGNTFTVSGVANYRVTKSGDLNPFFQRLTVSAS